MAEPFLSEIRIFSFQFAPKGWALCNGQLLPINQNQALFSLLGTTYGGDGRVNFALPDVRGRVPVHRGSGHTLGERGGEQAHTLTISEVTQHTHQGNASSSNGNQSFASGNVLAAAGNLYGGPGNLTQLSPTSVASVGGNQAHLNMQPFLTFNFCIALQGIFPSQT
jgi:microcystin-dependent protein